ncbi:MAG TPA: PilZ domain-containing protein [Terriglobales bacterium]|nr:PilZ domain-containing protein [Terriglobales bacterium]
MSETKTAAIGTDWTQLLTDPDLVSHLGTLLQTYREAPPEKREQALIDAMRQIKQGKPAASASARPTAQSTTDPPRTTSVPQTVPPFEPDIFTPSWGQDRRQYPRLKCFVAVELRLGNSTTPVWGNLSNTSMGGCFVETATPVPTGVNVEIGLWVANGKIWVKGMILNGIVTRSSPCFGVRVRYSELGTTERESLKEFLKFVETSTRGYARQNGYLAQIKR